MTTKSLSKAVQTQPKNVAVTVVEQTDLDEKIAMELVKFLRNPNMVNGPRKAEYRRAKDHFSKADDVEGIEWAFRYAAHKANESGPFARPERPSAESVGKLGGSTDTEKGVWNDSPFSA